MGVTIPLETEWNTTRAVSWPSLCVELVEDGTHIRRLK